MKSTDTNPAIAFGKVATDETPSSLDLNRLVAARPAATFYMALDADVEELGWRAGDIVVIDRSLDPALGKLVVAVVDGVFELRRYGEYNNAPALISLKTHSARMVDEADQLWGVVTYVVHRA